MSYKSQLIIILSCLKTYFDDNRLSVNVDKCEFMLFGTYQALRKISSPQIHINNEPLRQVSVAKYLGMYIDENLRWDHHIDTLKDFIQNWHTQIFEKYSPN